MAIDERAAYAQASWRHFDETVSDELLRAVTGAFALVAAADGDLAAAEVDRFMALLQEHAAVFSQLDFAELEHVFRDICGAIISDPEQGWQRALECVLLVRNNTDHVNLVRSAAQIAMAADAREADSEQKVLSVIDRALGVTAD
jgi:tellurite resistance protein